MRVLLVNMPFSELERPALGISLLKSALAECGIESDCCYANITFAERIGIPAYQRLVAMDTNLYTCAPEWLFAGDIFPEGLPSDDTFLAFLTHFEQVARSEPLSPLVHDLRRQAIALLDQLMDDVPFGDYDVVGFTSTFQQNLASLAMARRVKQAYPHVFTMMGGANCEGPMGVEIHRRFPWIDAVCSGEGDLAVPEFLHRMASGQPTDGLPAIIQRRGGVTVVPEQLVDPVRDMNALPYPNFDDYFAAAEASLITAGSTRRELPLESSRGCWWGTVSHCTFCGLNGNTMTYRTKDAERALDEIVTLTSRYGVADVLPTDNILNMQYFHTLLPALKARGMKLNLFYEVKANLTKDRVRLLRESGVTLIQPGIESFSTSILRLMRKGTTALQNVQLIKWCAEFGIQPVFNVLYRFPGEDPEEYPRMAALMESLSHLPAPATHGNIRIDRFSPYFEDPAAFGINRIEPWPGYRYIYPFDDDVLMRLGYYFCHDGLDPTLTPAYVLPVLRAIEGWRQARPHAKLTVADDGTTLYIEDTRPVARQPRYELRGTERELYLFCDRVQSLQTIAARVRERRPDVSDRQIQEYLDRMLDLRLMVRDGDRYLSLAVSLAPLLEKVRAMFDEALRVVPAIAGEPAPA